ncbi:MAG TPA: enoyl-CoA hydratase [Methylomirabilota bacterium]|jgi:enoyl-CoA hydratase/carnithine racemase|nr:enoyl-CoA hydratase [Methylomirabilota bacterium]
MGYAEILYEVDDRIATVTLNRPDKLNAWTEVMGREVRQAMHEAARDPDVRVIVLTGAGRGFCAGADMGLLSGIADGRSPRGAEEVAYPSPPAEDTVRADFRGPYAYFPLIPKPVIAALNGATAGLGFVIALYCDLRMASAAAVFTTAFARRGLVAEHGISWTLPRLIGLPNALDLMLSARKVSAEEALRMGLVSQVFPSDGLMAGVRTYARELAELVSPRSMRVMKRQLWEAQFQTLAEATAVADREMLESFTSEDFKEGVAHFVEKRAPAFTGR